MAFTWSEQTTSDSIGVEKTVWASALSLFVSVGNRVGNIGAGGNPDRVRTSPDGVTWTTRTAAKAYDWNSVAWSPSLGLFAAVTSSTSETLGAGITQQVMTSPDGTNWTARTNPDINNWRDITWSPTLGLFVAVAASGTNRVMTSPDGTNWTGRTEASVKSWNSVVWASGLGLFVATAGTAGINSIMTSPDGSTWTTQTSASFNFRNRSLSYSPTLGMLLVCTSNDHILTSVNATAWTDQGAKAFARSSVWDANDGLFIVTGGAPGPTYLDILTSPDGVVWTTENTDPGFIFAGGTLDAAGYSSDLGVVAITYNGNSTHVVTGVGGGSTNSITPNNGIPSGGDAFTITGNGLNGGMTGSLGGTAIRIFFGNYADTGLPAINEATSHVGQILDIPTFQPVDFRTIVAVDADHVTAETPIGDDGLRDVLVVGDFSDPSAPPNVLAWIPSGFTFNDPTPTSINPTSGSCVGYTPFTLTGHDFIRNNISGAPGEIRINGFPCAGLQVVNDTTITGLTPPSVSSGAKDLVYQPPRINAGNFVWFEYDSVTLPAAFTYQPYIGIIEPAFGCIGQSVTISGLGFAVGVTVTFGGVVANNIVRVSDIEITCDAPIHADGLVNVVVTNLDGTTVTAVNGFEYAMPWWRRTDSVSVENAQGNLETFVFETYIQTCARPDTGEDTILWFPYSTTPPARVWWTWTAQFKIPGWYVFQVNTPGLGWALAGAPPPDNNGWYFTTADFGGSFVTVANGRPKDGRTWADIQLWATGDTGMLGGSPAASVIFENHLIYPATGYTPGVTYPPIRVFDGSFDHELCQLPPTPLNTVPYAVLSMLAANGTMYLTTIDSGTTSADWKGRVFQLDLDSGSLSAIGGQFTGGEVPYALAWHMGRLWVGTNNGIGTVGKVYYFRPGIDTAWTLDHSNAANGAGGCDSMVSYNGKLYVGTDNAAASRGKVLVRDSAGAYTVSKTGTAGAVAAPNNGYIALAVFQGNLYASYWNHDTPAASVIEKFDGTVWTTAYTGAGTTIRPFIVLFEDNDFLIGIGGGMSQSGATIRTEDGTAWLNLVPQLPESTKTLTPIYGVEIL